MKWPGVAVAVLLLAAQGSAATAGSPPDEDDPEPLDSITVAASHELVEAATDPLIGAGWIDDSVPLNDFTRLRAGEVADICTAAGAAPANPRRRLGVLVTRYWSNSAGSCF